MENNIKFKRLIINREYYRTPSHPETAGDSVIVTLSCGHEKRFKGSQEPKWHAYCDQCLWDSRFEPVFQK